MVKAFCKYYLSRKTAAAVSNKFVSDLNSHVLSKISEIRDEDIQSLVNKLKKDKALVEIEDFGAGSKKTTSNSRTVSSIVNSAAISPKYGKMLSLLCSHFNCQTIIELGTSLGIGSYYLSLGDPNSLIHTIEGCKNISDIAQKNLNKNTNVKCYVGEFSSKLEEVLLNSGKPDLVYIDGNHTQKATVDYYNFFIKNANSKAILVFDDIHWSSGMEMAWEQIIASSSSRITIDLFRMGIVFLDPNLKKEHFFLKF